MSELSPRRQWIFFGKGDARRGCVEADAAAASAAPPHCAAGRPPAKAGVAARQAVCGAANINTNMVTAMLVVATTKR